MDLESLLSSGILYAGSEIADSTSTYFSVKKYGLEIEMGNAKNWMKKYGIKRGLLASSLGAAILVSSFASASWAIKKLVNMEIESFPSPMHIINIFAYMKYYASISNASYLFGWDKLHEILSAPLKLLLDDIKKE